MTVTWTGAPLRRVGAVRAARDVDEAHVVRGRRAVLLRSTVSRPQRRPMSGRRLPALPQPRPVPRQQGPRVSLSRRSTTESPRCFRTALTRGHTDHFSSKNSTRKENGGKLYWLFSGQTDTHTHTHTSDRVLYLDHKVVNKW